MSDVKRAANLGSAVALPIPKFSLPPLPDKIARIDPSGAMAWHREANAAFAKWVEQMNTVSSALSAAIKK